MSAPPVIQTTDLTRYYGPTVGVENLTFQVQAGEVFGFLGPNGAGKTTTIRLLLDLIRPTSGQARLLGCPPGDPAVRSRIGYLPGELSLDGRMTGHATLEFLSTLGGSRKETGSQRAALCQRLGLTDPDLRRRVREYSRGMKQKLGLVAAFQHQPDLLILDEPTTGLDPLVREVVFELMTETRSRGATVFHSSHVLSEVDRTCDRVGFLRSGKLLSVATMEDLRAQAQRTMHVTFSDHPPLDALSRAGARIQSTDGRRVTLTLSGGLAGLLSVLAESQVQHLSFPEPSIEDAFDSLYQDPGSSAE